jgi:hypothetical protein
MEECSVGEHEGNGEDTAVLVNVGTILSFQHRKEMMKVLSFIFYIASKQAILSKTNSLVPRVVKFDVEDHVISKIYYQKWGCNENGYVYLCNSNVTFIYTHLVLEVSNVASSSPNERR